MDNNSHMLLAYLFIKDMQHLVHVEHPDQEKSSPCHDFSLLQCIILAKYMQHCSPDECLDHTEIHKQWIRTVMCHWCIFVWLYAAAHPC